jgi:hypothetical protein
MQSNREFFVPFTTSMADAEAAYEQLAKMCHRAPPPKDQRIYSITFSHNGQIWEATVGQRLRGREVKTTKAKGVRREHEISLSDPAVVVAIYPGAPYFVATALEPNTGRSAWENPFMAGQPSSVAYFGQTQ